MESLDQDVRIRMLKAFRRFSFFIFRKELYSDVSKVIKESNLWQIVKIKSLGKGYFLLEPDERLYLAECRESCIKNGIEDEACIAKCESERRSKVLREVISKLTGE